jgi:hypothetical protein
MLGMWCCGAIKNGFQWKYVTVEGILMCRRDVQLLNAVWLIFSSPSGRVIITRFVQPWNARIPISLTVEGISTLVRDVQFLKLRRPIVSIPSQSFTQVCAFVKHTFSHKSKRTRYFNTPQWFAVSERNSSNIYNLPQLRTCKTCKVSNHFYRWRYFNAVDIGVQY